MSEIWIQLGIRGTLNFFFLLSMWIAKKIVFTFFYYANITVLTIHSDKMYNKDMFSKYRYFLLSFSLFRDFDFYILKKKLLILEKNSSVLAESKKKEKKMYGNVDSYEKNCGKIL